MSKMFTEAELKELCQRARELSKLDNLTAVWSVRLDMMADAIKAVYTLMAGDKDAVPAPMSTPGLTPPAPMSTPGLTVPQPASLPVEATLQDVCRSGTVRVRMRSFKLWTEEDSVEMDDPARGILTPQGYRRIRPGDYLITAMDGARYVCPASKYSPDFDVEQGMMLTIDTTVSHASPVSLGKGRI